MPIPFQVHFHSLIVAISRAPISCYDDKLMKYPWSYGSLVFSQMGPWYPCSTRAMPFPPKVATISRSYFKKAHPKVMILGLISLFTLPFLLGASSHESFLWVSSPWWFQWDFFCGGNSSTYNWGELTHKNDSWDEPPSNRIHSLGTCFFYL